MKLLIALCLLGVAAADLEGNAYVRDLLFESTTRGFEVSDATGDFICEPGYTGSDCSLLKCPYAPSFVAGTADDWLYSPSNGKATRTEDSDATSNTQSLVVSNSFDNHHVYKECGGRGVCDRSSGVCKCFESFTGEGCRRTTCPNDCSGHGSCQTDTLSHYIYESSSYWGNFGNDGEGYTDSPTWGSRWSWDKFAQCKCDRGYEGSDCSQRRCPRGDDPETECSDELAYDVQEVSLSGTGSDDHFTLQFTDQMGGTYTTRPIIFQNGSPDDNERAVQTALEALPNFAIPTIEIEELTTGVVSTGDVTYDFEVHFVDEGTTGQQQLLSVNSRQHDGSCDSGAQPKFTGGQVTGTVTRQSIDVGTMKENSECGGRGLCDRNTGTCSCFDGYYGASCSQITTYI